MKVAATMSMPTMPSGLTRDMLAKAAAEYGVPEGAPSCATCIHASPVPDGDGGAERNVYCDAADRDKHPDGLKVRRTDECPKYHPSGIAARAVAAYLSNNVIRPMTHNVRKAVRS